MADEPTKTLIVPPILGLLSAFCADEPKRYSTDCVQVTEDEKTLTYSATDGKMAIRAVIKKPGERKEATKFPDFSKVIPTGTPLVSLLLDAKRLRLILDVLIETDENVLHNACVKIDWHGEGKPCVFTSFGVENGVTAILMPMERPKGELSDAR